MKNWSTLEKGDRLYALIPFTDKTGNISYNLQESQVINLHQYENHVNVRIKYTDVSGKRRRIELCINRTKYELPYVSDDKLTGFVISNKIKFGDIIVTYHDLNVLDIAYKEIINDKIKEVENIINTLKQRLSYLNNKKYISFTDDCLEDRKHI